MAVSKYLPNREQLCASVRRDNSVPKNTIVPCICFLSNIVEVSCTRSIIPNVTCRVSLITKSESRLAMHWERVCGLDRAGSQNPLAFLCGNGFVDAWRLKITATYKKIKLLVGLYCMSVSGVRACVCVLFQLPL